MAAASAASASLSFPLSDIKACDYRSSDYTHSATHRWTNSGRSVRSCSQMPPPPPSSLSPSSLCSSNPLHDVTENSSFHSGHSTPSAVVLHCSAAWKVKEVKQEELQESFCFRLQGRLPAVKQSGGKYDL